MSTDGSGLATTQTAASVFGILLLSMLLSLLLLMMLLTLLAPLQCKIIACYEFLAAFFAVLTILLQVALDALTCNVWVWMHKLHDGRGTGMLEAYIKNGRYEISMELIRPSETLGPPLIHIRSLPLLSSTSLHGILLHFIGLDFLGRSTLLTYTATSLPATATTLFISSMCR